MSEVINLVGGSQKENRSPHSTGNGFINVPDLYTDGLDFSSEVDIIEEES